MTFPLKYKTRDGTHVMLIGINPETKNLMGFTVTCEFDPNTLCCVFPENCNNLDLVEQVRPDSYGAST